MEHAAEQIVELAIADGDWNSAIVGYDQMGDKSGFLQLISFGWLSPFLFSKDKFLPNQAFIDRVTKRIKGDNKDKVAKLKPLSDIPGVQELGIE
jgi:hypothetical protein